jgi:indolepyruvate ferredoxin oxidoreductase alpha subunit
MGGAISFASGVAHSGSKVPVLALCGDGGFLHGGISALANAVFNEAQIVVLLLDNGTLGNTGLQPTGCTGSNVVGERVPRVDLEGICRSMGVPYVVCVQPLDVNETKSAIQQALDRRNRRDHCKRTVRTQPRPRGRRKISVSALP